MLAMRRALLALPVAPTHVRVDGNRCPCIADLPLGCTLEDHIIAGMPRERHQRRFDPRQDVS